MKEELKKELEERMDLLVKLVAVEEDKYIKERLIGRIRELACVMSIIERLEEERE